MAKFKVIIRTNFGELEVEGETVKELRDGLRWGALPNKQTPY